MDVTPFSCASCAIKTPCPLLVEIRGFFPLPAKVRCMHLFEGMQNKTGTVTLLENI